MIDKEPKERIKLTSCELGKTNIEAQEKPNPSQIGRNESEHRGQCLSGLKKKKKVF